MRSGVFRFCQGLHDVAHNSTRRIAPACRGFSVTRSSGVTTGTFRMHISTLHSKGAASPFGTGGRRGRGSGTWWRSTPHRPLPRAATQDPPHPGTPLPARTPPGLQSPSSDGLAREVSRPRARRDGFVVGKTPLPPRPSGALPHPALNRPEPALQGHISVKNPDALHHPAGMGGTVAVRHGTTGGPGPTTPSPRRTE